MESQAHTTTSTRKNGYEMECTQHQEVMAEVYSSNNPDLLNEKAWRRTYLFDLYHKIRGQGIGHNEALNDALAALSKIQLDDEGKPFYEE